MDVEGPTPSSPKTQNLSKTLKLTLLLINSTVLFIGGGGAVLLRVYFIHGGSKKWFSSLIQVGGWPLFLIPIAISHLHRRRHDPTTPLLHLPPSLLLPLITIGVLFGLDSYLFAFSVAYLPISTSALLSSSQMAFVAVFAYFIVKQKFSAFSVNAVVLLTVAAAILGAHGEGDVPSGVSKFRYMLGFVMTIAASALYGLTLPLMELVYARAKKKITYSLVMEMQIVISVAATGFCLVGMLVNKDFQSISEEARNYGLGEGKYYVVVVLGMVLWQMFNLGLMGTIACSSSLLAGVLGAVMLPVSQVIGVMFFHERFDVGKGLSLVLTLWGFVSYWYGEVQPKKKLEEVPVVELPSVSQ